jgi:hypothetical protein
MHRLTAVTAVATVLVVAALALGAKKPASLGGSWMVDSRHSDAQVITDGTTDNGKTKIDVTLGYARVVGALKLDDGAPTNSRVDLHIYPATSMTEPVGEDGQFKSRWMANRANQTMLCFHSNKVARTADGIGYGIRSDFESNFGRYLTEFGQSDDDDAEKKASWPAWAGPRGCHA